MATRGEKTGYLKKKIAKKTLFGKKGHTKFFVLDNDALKWWPDNTRSGAPADVILLRDLTAFRDPSTDREYGAKGGFDLVAQDRTFTFAPTADLDSPKMARAIVSKVAALLDDSITFEMEMPSAQEEIDAMFDRFLEARNMPEQVRPQLRMQPNDKKWAMICTEKALLQQGAGTGEDHTQLAEDWRKKLRARGGEISEDEVRTLATIARTEPMAWLQAFFDHGGVTELLTSTALISRASLESLAPKPEAESKVACELLGVYTALMNNNHGMQRMLNIPHAVATLTNALDANMLANPDLSKRAVLILAVVCNEEGGHELVLNALRQFRRLRGQDEVVAVAPTARASRFSDIDIAMAAAQDSSDSSEDSDDDSEDEDTKQSRAYVVRSVGRACFSSLVNALRDSDDVDFQSRIAQLINMLIDKTDDLQERVQLRNEFNRLDALASMESALEAASERVEALRAKTSGGGRRKSGVEIMAASDDGAKQLETDDAQVHMLADQVTRFKLSLLGDSEEYRELSGYSAALLEDENNAVDPADVTAVFDSLLREVRLAGHDREVALIDILASLEMIPSDLAFGMDCWSTAQIAVRNVAKAQLMSESRTGGPPKQRDMDYYTELLDLRRRAQEFSRMAGGTDELEMRINKQQQKIAELQQREKIKVKQEVERAIADQRGQFELERDASEKAVKAANLHIADLEVELKAAAAAPSTGAAVASPRAIVVDPDLIATNWVKKVDKKSQKTYWGNTVTKTTKWKTPKCVKAALKAAAAAPATVTAPSGGSSGDGGASLKELAAANARVEAAEAKAERAAASATVQLDAARAQVEAQKSRAAASEQECTHLRDRVAEVEADSKSSSKQRDEARAAMAESEARLRSLRERMSDIQSSATSSADLQLDALREKYENLQGEIAAAQSRSDQEKEDASHRLSRAEAACTERIADAEENAAQRVSRAEAQSLKRSTELEAAIADGESKVSSLTEEVETLRAQLESAAEELTAATSAAMTAPPEAAEGGDDKLEAAQDAIEELKEQLGAEKEKAQKLGEKAGALEKKVAAAEKRAEVATAAAAAAKAMAAAAPPAAMPGAAMPAMGGMPTMGAMPAMGAMPGAGAMPPAMPGMPGAMPPAMPGMPGAEAMPAMPGMPGAGAMPGMPGAGAMPGMPAGGDMGMPAMPSMGMPAMGGMPAMPGGMPGMPMPGGGGMPGMPMPGGAPGGKKKPTGKPKVKWPKGVRMRAFFWSKIKPAELEGTVWSGDAGKDEPVVAALDVDDLVDYFGLRKKSKKGGGGGDDEVKVVKKKKEKAPKAELIDGKTEQNVGLAIARIRTTNDNLVKAILGVDDVIVTPELAGNLIKCIPTKDQAATCRAYEGDVRGMSKVEIFFRDISVVPALDQRLAAVKYMASFEDEMELLEESSKTVRSAMMQLVDGKRLDQLLRLLLAIGNFMNGTKGAGGCSGFKMDTLKKLDETRTQATSPHKLTLTMYLVRVARRGVNVSGGGSGTLTITEDTIALDKDWPTLSAACQINFAQLPTTLQQLSTGLKRIDNLIKATKPDGPSYAGEGDRFADEAASFAFGAKKSIDRTRKIIDQIDAKFATLCTRYGEDANELKDAAREDYVKLFNTFMRSLAAAGEKLDKIAATEAKAKATAEAKAAKAAKKKARGNVAATSASSDLEGAGAFDRFAEFEKLSPEEQLERMKEERKAKGKKKKKKKKNMGGGHGAMQAQLAAMMAAKAAK